ncbi:epoxide hydrolase family protein [Pseudonocardia xishanensis]|uniref:Epoxide hydrolase n=1 Tax=Pseudonocardia xishanensis TaxID=630995 RepID=A0ABP8S001_9PSEU
MTTASTSRETAGTPREGVTPFEVHVTDEDLSDLRERLSRTRWPDQIPGSGWGYGTDRDYLRDLCGYWETTFDWRSVESRLNQWPQFVTTIDGQQVHAIHARSKEPSATPLLLLHGWPGSVMEFLSLIGPLTDPVANGGRAEDAFHVICPSLPGFAWSGPTTEPGWDAARITTAMLTLMDRFGYERFGVQGGDWGAVVATRIAAAAPERVIGLQLNFVVTAGPIPEDGDPTAEEQQLLAEMGAHLATGSGYVAIQSTRPQSLAYGLTDSPAGLAGWIVEKLHAWTDCGGDVETAISRDEILANLSAYWFTGTIGSSTRIYCESERSGNGGPLPEAVTVPTGCAMFPRELFRPSRRWADRHYSDIRRWTVMQRGGHFAALEQPDALLTEIRAFFAALA